jgi:hypothetical protein
MHLHSYIIIIYLYVIAFERGTNLKFRKEMSIRFLFSLFFVFSVSLSLRCPLLSDRRLVLAASLCVICAVVCVSASAAASVVRRLRVSCGLAGGSRARPSDRPPQRSGSGDGEEVECAIVDSQVRACQAAGGFNGCNDDDGSEADEEATKAGARSDAAAVRTAAELTAESTVEGVPNASSAAGCSDCRHDATPLTHSLWTLDALTHSLHCTPVLLDQPPVASSAAPFSDCLTRNSSSHFQRHDNGGSRGRSGSCSNQCSRFRTITHVHRRAVGQPDSAGGAASAAAAAGRRHAAAAPSASEQQQPIG